MKKNILKFRNMKRGNPKYRRVRRKIREFKRIIEFVQGRD